MKFSTALTASLAVHGLVAVGVIAWLRALPAPEVTAQLELSSVELSFADSEDATAAIQRLEAAPAAEKTLPKSELAAPMPTLETPPPAPPDAAAVKLPEPLPREVMTPPAPSVAAPQQAKIDAPPKPRVSLRPKYPVGARRRGEQGDVVLEISVDARGRVEAVAVATSSGVPELDAAAVAATKAAAFTPALSGGRAVSAIARLTVSFRLN